MRVVMFLTTALVLFVVFSVKNHVRRTVRDRMLKLTYDKVSDLVDMYTPLCEQIARAWGLAAVISKSTGEVDDNRSNLEDISRAVVLDLAGCRVYSTRLEQNLDAFSILELVRLWFAAYAQIKVCRKLKLIVDMIEAEYDIRADVILWSAANSDNYVH